MLHEAHRDSFIRSLRLLIESLEIETRSKVALNADFQLQS